MILNLVFIFTSRTLRVKELKSPCMHKQNHKKIVISDFACACKTTYEHLRRRFLFLARTNMAAAGNSQVYVLMDIVPFTDKVNDIDY